MAPLQQLELGSGVSSAVAGVTVSVVGRGGSRGGCGGSVFILPQETKLG